MLHVVLLLLSRSKKGDHGTSFESDREGGAESLWNSFFQLLGDGQRPVHSAPIVVAAVYLGIYIYIYCIAIIKSNQIYLDTEYLKMTQGCLQ